MIGSHESENLTHSVAHASSLLSFLFYDVIVDGIIMVDGMWMLRAMEDAACCLIFNLKLACFLLFFLLILKPTKTLISHPILAVFCSYIT
jgi:hypothetical protein